MQAIGRIAGTKARGGTDAAVAARLARHAQGKSSVEELMLELYYGNLSVEEAEGMSRRLWPGQVALPLIADYARQTVQRIESWLTRPILAPPNYVFIHSVSVRRKQSGKAGATTLYAAVGVDHKGTREALSVSRSVGPAEESWRQFLAGLQLRGVQGIGLLVGPNDPAAVAAAAAYFPGTLYQGEPESLLSDAVWLVPVSKVPMILAGFDRIRAADGAAVALAAADHLVRALQESGEAAAACSLEQSFAYQFNYFHCPPAHWPRLREGGPLRAALIEWRGWVRKAGPFADDRVLELMLAARLRHLAQNVWPGRRYLACPRSA